MRLFSVLLSPSSSPFAFPVPGFAPAGSFSLATEITRTDNRTENHCDGNDTDKGDNVMAVVTRVVVMVMMKPQLATGGQAKILNFVEPCDSDDDDDDDNDNGDNGDRDSDGDDVGGGDGGNVNDDDDGGGGDDDDNGDGGGGGDDDHDHDHDGGGGGGGDDDDGTSDSHVRYVQVCDNTRYSTYTLGTNIFLANLLHLPALRHGDADAVSVKPHLTQVTTDHEPAESDRPTINTPTTHILQE